MKRIVTWGSVAMVALALTGCSAAEKPAETTPAPASASTESTPEAAEATAEADAESPTQEVEPTADENLSERGNRIIKIGDEMSVKNDSGDEVVKYKITGLKPITKCSNFYLKPANGHYLELSVEAQTFAGVEEDSPAGWTLHATYFKQILPDGTTSNADPSSTPGLNCLTSKELINDMGSNEKAKGSVVLDLESTKGTLIYKTFQEDGNWEIEIPAK